MKTFSLSIALALGLFLGTVPYAAYASGGGEEAVVEDTGPIYVKIQPLVLPMIGDKGVEQMISLVVALEVKDKSIADKVIAMSPRLANAYIMDLYGAIDGRKVMTGTNVVDVTKLRDHIQKASARILGDDVVQDVLIQAVAQRRV